MFAFVLCSWTSGLVVCPARVAGEAGHWSTQGDGESIGQSRGTVQEGEGGGGYSVWTAATGKMLACDRWHFFAD